MVLSNSQLTKLGDRLRKRQTRKDDLEMLDEFRQTFERIDLNAFNIIQDTFEVNESVVITKRKRKTQQSIVDKLRRQKNLRLPQMQDIAGCRIVIKSGIDKANKMNAVLTKSLEQHKWETKSSIKCDSGYHAIHIVTKMEQKFYEIQLRTFAQDLWANLVESASKKNNTLKYGGDEEEQPLISKLNELAMDFNAIDKQAHTMSFTTYEQKIQEAIQDVFSHRA